MVIRTWILSWVWLRVAIGGHNQVHCADDLKTTLIAGDLRQEKLSRIQSHSNLQHFGFGLMDMTGPILAWWDSALPQAMVTSAKITTARNTERVPFLSLQEVRSFTLEYLSLPATRAQMSRSKLGTRGHRSRRRQIVVLMWCFQPCLQGGTMSLSTSMALLLLQTGVYFP